MYLLTRVFSMVPSNLREVAWEGPLDHDLLGFNSLIKALHRSLRNVVEGELLARVLRRDCTAPVQAYGMVAYKLPFRRESNTALGIVLKHVLLQPAAARAELAESFPNFIDIEADLLRGCQFWNELLRAMRLLAATNEVSDELLASFESAHAYLLQFFPQAPPMK